jgi:hypothetical protein
MVACRFGFVDAAKASLHMLCNTEGFKGNYFKLLMYTSQGGNVEILNMLLEYAPLDISKILNVRNIFQNEIN